jgi:hypothetical protein
MLETLTNRKLTAGATALAIAAAAVLSLSGTAQAGTEPAPVAAHQITPSAAKTPLGAKHKVKLNARQRRALQRDLRRKAARVNGKSFAPYLGANNELVIVTGDHWEFNGCNGPHLDAAGGYYWSVCLYVLVRGNSGYVLQNHLDYYWWNGHEWVSWFSRDS